MLIHFRRVYVSICVFNGDEDGVVQFLKRHRIADVVLLSNSSFFYYLRKSPGLLSIFLFFSVFVPQVPTFSFPLAFYIESFRFPGKLKILQNFFNWVAGCFFGLTCIYCYLLCDLKFELYYHTLFPSDFSWICLEL